MHTVRERQKLIARVRRIRGQIEGIERALVAFGRGHRRRHCATARLLLTRAARVA
jgi:hypothetical protein